MQVALHPGFLTRSDQQELLRQIRAIIDVAPLFVPRLPKSGKPFSVKMTNCGSLGWVSDLAGYRYQPLHPETGRPWPPMPKALLEAWERLSNYPFHPEACLINFYSTSAKMGLHQERDEADLEAPVVSLSLGDTCIFRIGRLKKTDPTQSIRLASGDAVVLGGNARLAFHGVDRKARHCCVRAAEST
jgi:alkylated DNA repair protein (DNA oxidative demethylase)